MKGVKSKLIILGFTVFSLIFFSSVVQADDSRAKSPIDKGSINIGGTFSIQSSGGDLYESSKGDRQTTAIFTTGNRYFILPSIAVGGDIMYLRTSQSDVSATQFGIGPALSYFFDVKSDKIYPYVGVGLLYYNYSVDLGQWDTSTTGFDFRFGGGLAYMLGKNLALVVELNYHLQSLKPEEGDSQSGNILAFTVGFAAFLF